LPDRRLERQAAHRPPDLLRARGSSGPRAAAARAHHAAAALRPVPLADADHAAGAAAAADGRPAFDPARPAHLQRLPHRLRRWRRDTRPDRRARRDRPRALPVPARGRHRLRAPHVRAACCVRELRAGPAHRRGAGRAEQRHAGADRGGGGHAEEPAQPEARRHPAAAAGGLARPALRGHRPPGEDADGACGRSADLAGHDHAGAAQRGPAAAAERPRRAAGRTAGAHGRGLAQRPAGGVVAQDGLPAGRSGRLPGRARRAAPHPLRSGAAAAPDAAADPRRPAGGGAGRPGAPPHRGGRGRVQRADEGGAGARAVPRHRRCVAGRLREDRRSHRRAQRARDRPAGHRLPAHRHRQADRDTGTRRVSARRRRRRADRAERQLAGAPDQQHDRRGAQGRRVGHPHRELPGAREDPHPLPQGRAAAHLPRAAAELPQRGDRAHQDHVRPRHQREAQAAGRQDRTSPSSSRSTASNCAWRPSRPRAGSRTW
jgi:hypothetical protein